MPTDDVGNQIIFDGLSGQPRGDIHACLGPQARKRKDLSVQIPNPPPIGTSVYITKVDYQDPYDSGIPQDDNYLAGIAKKGENAPEGIGTKAHFSSNNKGSGRDGRRDESEVSGGRGGRIARSGAGARAGVREAEGWGTSVLTRHAGTVRDMAVSPDGKLVASASGDHLIHISHLPVPASATARISFEPPHGGAGSSTNGPAAGAAGEVAAVSGAGVLVLRGHTHVVSGVSFSPDGGFLVSSSFDKTLRLWVCCLGEANSEAGQEGGAPSSGGNSDGGGPWRLLAVMEGHRESVSCVSWRPSGLPGKEKEGEKVAKLLQQIETHYTQNVYRDRKERLLSRKGAHGERDGGGGARQGGDGRAFAEREREREIERDDVRVQELCVVSGSADHAVVIWQVSLTTA
jgi:WD40 repeat protein